VYATWRSEENILFSHIPIHPRSLGSVVANVHGHIHQNPDYPPVVIPEWRKENGKIIPARVIPYVNVSVEVIEYRPMHLDTLLQRIKRVTKEHENAITLDARE
jgi:calcineurin-like phosphoesterase family protein